MLLGVFTGVYVLGLFWFGVLFRVLMSWHENELLLMGLLWFDVPFGVLMSGHEKE